MLIEIACGTLTGSITLLSDDEPSFLRSVNTLKIDIKYFDIFILEFVLKKNYRGSNPLWAARILLSIYIIY